MGTPVPLPDLPDPPPGGGPLLVEFGYGWADALRLWRTVLAMAVRDGAASAHYHPWRADGHLSYVVAGTRYELVPPPAAAARTLTRAAGALACGNPLGAAARRWLGWPRRAAGRVRLAGPAGVTEWAGVVWAVGRLGGVEWYRIGAGPGAAPPAGSFPGRGRVMRAAAVGCVLLGLAGGCNRAERRSLIQFREATAAAAADRHADDLRGVPGPLRTQHTRLLFARGQVAAVDGYLAADPPLGADARRAVEGYRAGWAQEAEIHEKVAAEGRAEPTDDERRRIAELRAENARMMDLIARVLDG